MAEIVPIIGLAWFACLLVQAWKDLLWRTKHLKSMKPFSCQMCMGFWLGCLYFIHKPILEMIIFASILSLVTVLIYHITSIVGRKNTSV